MQIEVVPCDATYVAGKTELIARILAGVGFDEEELAAIADANAS